MYLGIFCFGIEGIHAWCDIYLLLSSLSSYWILLCLHTIAKLKYHILSFHFLIEWPINPQNPGFSILLQNLTILSILQHLFWWSLIISKHKTYILESFLKRDVPKCTRLHAVLHIQNNPPPPFIATLWKANALLKPCLKIS